MENFLEHLQNLTNAHSIISQGGFCFLLIIVFAETGLFFGFFLPGDYLLFTSGLLCANGILQIHITTLVLSLILSGIFGNYAGYLFGYRTGHILFNRDDSLMFKRRYVLLAQQFYTKYGGMALILGRFFPIIRTFAPIFAGIVKVDLKKFTLYNIVGSIAWVVTLCLSGYFLGKRFPLIKEYLLYVIIGFFVITTVPFVIAFFQKKHIQHNKIN
jgi:membrane-associated protein